MPTGFSIYRGDDFVCSFDSEKGIRFPPPEDARLKRRYYEKIRDARVSSERHVMDYLTSFGVENIKNVKFVEPQFPQCWKGRNCSVLIEIFAEAMVESRKSSARGVADDLKKYCGIIVDY